MAKQQKFSEAIEHIVSAPPISIPSHELFYLPILKGKAGELGALKELDIAVKSKILPLIEIPPVPWDYVNERPAKTPNNHVKGFLKRLIESCELSYPLIIDTSLTDIHISGSQTVLDYVLSELHSKSIEAIPVVMLSDQDVILDAVKNNLTEVTRVCLRINSDSLGDYDMSVDVPNLLSKLSISQENVDLLLDFGYFTDDQKGVYISMAKMTINMFPQIEKYNSLTLAMTAFPTNLAGFSTNSIVNIPRSEWVVWNKVVSDGSIKRKPTFGDYAISNPNLQDIDPRIMQMSASIRYTTDENWHIIKGAGVRRFGFEQFYALSQMLINSPFYKGATFSWGDNMINEKASKVGGTGNATTWRQIGTNHHLSLVAEQLISN